MTDERAFSRYSVPQAAQIHATVAFGGQRYDGQALDLSLRGLFVGIQDNIPHGTEVQVTLRTGGEHAGIPLTCRGRVIRKSQQGVGIEIRHMDGRTFTQYRNLVAAICRDPEQMDSELRTYVNRPT
jgi:hypothetical protein